MQVAFKQPPTDTNHSVMDLRRDLVQRNEPSQITRRFRQPLLTPNDSERDGYIPNVVYSCGAVVHNGELILPYAMSDYATTFGTIPIDELIAAMEPE